MSHTAQPPRREMYELETNLGTHAVPSFLPKPGRIAGNDWMEKRADVATAVWNGHYSAEGGQIIWHTKPWCVMTPTDFQSFDTHAEALTYAFTESTSPAQARLDDAARAWRKAQ